MRRAWVKMPVHATYGQPGLPELQVIRLEGDLTTKISRLNRTTTARDFYDLAWLATHQRDIGGLDTSLIRRLIHLKVWADANGFAAASVRWKPGHEPRAFARTSGCAPEPRPGSTSQTLVPSQSRPRHSQT